MRFLFWFLCAGVAASVASEDKTIVCLGDSLTAGYGLLNPDAQAWPGLLQDKLDTESRPWRVINAGISGDTTAGGLRRVSWLLRQRIDILILALGGNDGLRGIDPTVTRENLVGIIDRVRTRYPEVRIVLAGMQMPANLGADYQARYHAIFPAVAEEKGCVLIPFLLEGVGGVPALNQPDLIHPTSEGQKRIATTVWQTLRPLLQQDSQPF
ncbi:MAG: arylesterase [Opitutaceae bacterium]|nr:arylesterase [Opitutaceae bacterium]